jgi:hypothetical protein
VGNRRPIVIAAATIPAVGVVAALAASALAAGTTPDASTPRTALSVQCYDPSAPAVVPPGAIQSLKYSNIGSGGVVGTLKAIPTYTDANYGTLTPTLVRVAVTVSFSRGTTGFATLRLPGHEYRIPLQVVNPPITETLLLGPNSVTTFQLSTSGKATANLAAYSFVGAATKAQQHVVAGQTCAPGETANAVITGTTPAPPPASGSPASGSPSASPTASGAPSPLPSPIPL